VAGARAQAARARGEGLFARLEEARAEHASIDVGFRWLIRWTAFLPGAVVFAVGLEALHLMTVYYLADKLASQSALYGALGLAASLLFFLFLFGRGVVWSAELNAVVWDLRTGGRARDPRAPFA
jgi:uncharacterized BrkB/YihY/UPF0761 family membrane protein